MDTLKLILSIDCDSYLECFEAMLNIWDNQNIKYPKNILLMADKYFGFPLQKNYDLFCEILEYIKSNFNKFKSKGCNYLLSSFVGEGNYKINDTIPCITLDMW